MRAPFVAIFLSIALAGCGGGDEDDGKLGKITPADVAEGKVEPERVEDNLLEQLEQKGQSDRVKKVDCPKRKKTRQREVFYCVLTADDGSRARITVVPDARDGGVKVIDAKPLK